jgi:UDP-glucose:(heptosyl)LPS alpha-1,3-glucosyltransferase
MKTMRICLTHMRHANSGGTELYLNYLAAYLCERGHDVTIVCRSHGELPHPRARFVVLRSFALVKTWRMWAFARSVERHIRSTPYDVVLGLGKTWNQDVIRLGGGSHRTFLESMNGSDAATSRLRLKDRLALGIERRALAAGTCRHIIVNSQMVRHDIMTRYDVPSAKIEVIYNGVDIERFHPRNRAAGAEIRQAAGFGPEHLVFLFLGSGYKRKGLDLLLKAFQVVAKARPEARLLVVGYDSDLESYRKQAQQLGCGKKVHFLGGRSDPEYCYGAADVYVLPTRYDPFANSTLEALATGLPVITTDGNGGGELIEAGVQGGVVPLRDGVGGLSAELLRWCDASRIRIASDAARRLAEQHDHLSKMKATEQVLRKAVRRR